MTIKTRLAWQVSLGLLFVLSWVCIPAFANGNENGHENGNGHKREQTPPTQVQGQGQVQGQVQGQMQGQTTDVDVTAQGGNAQGGAAYATATGGEAQSNAISGANNEGIDIDASDNSRIENNSSNVVLVPNNNTENCLRVWGIAWGESGKSGALGVPWRSKKCDTEAAADDAAADDAAAAFAFRVTV